MTVRVEITADRRFGTNSYLVEDDKTHDAVVIDSNLEPELVIEVAKQRGANVKAILLTHTDIDHIAGLHELRGAFGPVPIAVHAAEKDVIAEGRPLPQAADGTLYSGHGPATTIGRERRMNPFLT